MKYIILISLLLVTLGIFSCRRCDDAMPGPQTIVFEIKKDGKAVSDSVLKGAELYWIEGGVRKYENEKQAGVELNTPLFALIYIPRDAGFDSSHPLLISTSASSVSSAKGIKDFYIEYKDGSTDTVFIDFQQDIAEEGRCPTTSRVFKAIKFRGADVPVDSSLRDKYHYWQPIYIINK